MELSEINNSFLKNVLEKVSFEKKIIALLGDFDAELMHYYLDRDVSDFLDLIYSSISNYNTIKVSSPYWQHIFK